MQLTGVVHEHVPAQIADGQERSHPKCRANPVEDEKLLEPHFALPGYGWGQRRKSGYELGDRPRGKGMENKDVLRATDAGRGFKRELADQAHHSMPTAADEQELGGVGNQCATQAGKQRERKAKRVSCREGSGRH